MLYNYHAHTFRCGHASGVEENYIKRAIENGIKKMGFSDHIFFKHDDGYESKFRVPTDSVEDYFNTLKALREKYKDQIEIYIGFEMEYYAPYFDVMLKRAIDAGAEYFILGQHHVDTDRFDDYDNYRFVNVFEPSDNEEDFVNQVNAIINAAKTGYISYIAHPDCFNFTGSSEIYKREARRMLTALKDLNVPVEINMLGVRTNRHYPRLEFWQLAGEIGTPVVIGMDAHDEIDAYDGESVDFAMKYIKKLNLNFISNYTPKLINK